MNILCISIDGLHSGMIGAMGNGWIRTPALDALACRSIVFDRYCTETLDLPSIFDSLWNFPFDNEFETILLTDDSDVYLHEKAETFSERHRLDFSNENKPAETLEETRFFKAFATIVDILGGRKEQESEPLSHTLPPAPFFLWAHLQGFRGPWDFPLEYRERHRDEEEDPEPYDGTAPPNSTSDVLGDATDPDVLQSVMEAYSGGVSVLDDALAGLLDWLDDEPYGNETAIVFVSTRGFSLDEHGRIGADETLYGENVHLPLFVRLPNDAGATVRSFALARPDDLGRFLYDRQSDLGKLIREETGTEAETKTLHEKLFFRNENGETALLTPDWFLRQRSEADGFRIELYAKPDDRWEVNDVADRCPEIVEQLLAVLSEHEKK